MEMLVAAERSAREMLAARDADLAALEARLAAVKSVAAEQGSRCDSESEAAKVESEVVDSNWSSKRRGTSSRER